MRGIKLKKDDVVVSLSVIAAEQQKAAELLAVTECGFGKRTPLSEYPVQGAAGKGSSP